ncbi:MAG: TRAP transporter small permease [Nitrososphaeria archaeon]
MRRLCSLGEKEGKFVQYISHQLESIGAVAILVIMCVTCVDIVGAKLLKWRLFGAIDIVMLSQVVAISLSAGATLLAGRHITVEFFLRRLSRKSQKVINLCVYFVLIAFTSIAIWRLALLGYSFYKSGEHSATAKIPLFPFPLVISIGLLPFVLKYLERISEELRKT